MFHSQPRPSKLHQMYSDLDVLRDKISSKQDYINKLSVSLAILTNNNIPAEILMGRNQRDLMVDESNINEIYNDALQRLKKVDRDSYNFHTAPMFAPSTFYDKKSQTINIFKELQTIAKKEFEELELDRINLQELIAQENSPSSFTNGF
ncbi:hypothetical protein [Legionella drozanskii]|uniref:Uncharacterized protein n=1 Tax=Legionella drozanskii LLAP-1 TaxID=1212489 RepID=A0A0W0SWL4_9GAMM|nr:hypothetical protein [Legionella drozanskii]KTC87689.1 hypothetical protein Ldro_1308 [Legionella drozanskii LLAP-1]